MKGKINAAGHLSIERRGRFKSQFCRHSLGESYCGDWCPLFIEGVRQGYGSGEVSCGAPL